MGLRLDSRLRGNDSYGRVSVCTRSQNKAPFRRTRDQAESGSLLRRNWTERERCILSNSLTSASPTSVAATP
jgi:hypothetical protein